MLTRAELSKMNKIGLYESVDTVVLLRKTDDISLLYERAFALHKLNRFTESAKLLEEIMLNEVSVNILYDILELLLLNYFRAEDEGKYKKIIMEIEKLGDIPLRLLLIICNVYEQLELSIEDREKVIKHYMRILEQCPFAIQLVEKALNLGADPKEILAKIPEKHVKEFAGALISSFKGLVARSNAICLNMLAELPLILPVLRLLCLNAFKIHDYVTFDRYIEDIPIHDLTVVDIRAKRLKLLKNNKQLLRLVLTALNTNENDSNSWVAFSHYLDCNDDHTRALQASRKALILDKRNRRAYIHYGDLRFLRKEYKKAITAYHKAHRIQRGIDTFSAIIRSHCELGNWEDAHVYAVSAVNKYPKETELGLEAFTLLGLSKKGTDKQKAIEIFRLVLSKAPRNRMALEALVNIEIEEKRYDEAEKLLDQYVQDKDKTSSQFTQDIDLFFYNYKMGHVLFCKKDFKRAFEYAQKASQILPGDEKVASIIDQLEGFLRDDYTCDEEEDDIFYQEGGLPQF